MTTKALLSFGVGPAFEEMLDVAQPSFEHFADLHGYDYVRERFGGRVLARPASWYKIELFLDLLDGGYDEVLWVDADAIIVDAADDLDVPPDAWQALACHSTPDGDVPSCGTWLVREEMAATLERIWEMTEYLHHGWWEQRAVAHLLGFEGSPLRHVHTTDLWRRTHWLDNGWSVHVKDRNPVARPRILQATQYPDRLAQMRQWDSERGSSVHA